MTDDERVTVWVGAAARHLRGDRCLLYAHPERFGNPLLPASAADVLWWLQDRAAESLAVGMGREPFRRPLPAGWLAFAAGALSDG